MQRVRSGHLYKRFSKPGGFLCKSNRQLSSSRHRSSSCRRSRARNRPPPAGAAPLGANGGQGLGALPPAGAWNGLATSALPPREAFASPQDDGGLVGKSRETSQANTHAFMMSTSLPPVPGRIVAKIKARQFVAFAELLADNAELLRRESERDYGPPAWSRPQL